MKKFLLLITFLILGTYASAKEHNIFLDKLSDYNLTVLSENKNILHYTGSKNKLSLSFWANERDVLKIIYAFSSQDKDKYIAQILDVSKNLMPKQFSKSDDFEYKFLRNLNKLKEHRDNEAFLYNNVRFDMKLSNGMITINASPSKFYGKF